MLKVNLFICKDEFVIKQGELKFETRFDKLSRSARMQLEVLQL